MSRGSEAQEDMTKLRRARIAAGLSLDALAFRAGVSRYTLSLAERAPELMSSRTLTKVAKVLGVSPEELEP